MSVLKSTGNLSPTEILKKYWGYSAFRPLQEDIILSAINGNDTLALLPTGGGKSICFQVPALAMEGMCIVVSPLIALMKDQVANLIKRGIKAVAIYSGMSAAEIDIAVDNCIYGDTKFLYLSPERLITDLIRQRLPKMKVNLLAIDEAHCVSQWGYDFRPPYLKIAEIREFIPGTPVLALTATATPEVMKDICLRLELKNPGIFVKSFERKNLTYAVINEENKFSRLLKICSKVPGTGIVYVRNRRKTKEIAEFLQKNNISSDYYHAGLDGATRDLKQQQWTSNKKRVIVSTNAFGMGIDKPDVRFVVHMDLPDSPEAYFQEAGRAGRDEKTAYAVLLYNKSDIADLQHSFENSFPGPEFIKKIYNALCNYFKLAIGTGNEKSFDFHLNDFCSNYNLERITTFNALKFLEREGFISLSEALASPSKMMILLNKEELYRFIVANPQYDSLLKMILRSYTGLFSAFVKIDEYEIAKRFKAPVEEVRNRLRKMHHLRVIHYEPTNTEPRITFTGGRYENYEIIISPENYADRKKFASGRMLAMKNYTITTVKCRSVMLLNYFGQKDATPCGKCDVCLQRNKTDISEKEYTEIELLINSALKNNHTSVSQLLNNLKTNIPEKKILKTLQWLIDQEKIFLDPDNDTLRPRI